MMITRSEEEDIRKFTLLPSLLIVRPVSLSTPENILLVYILRRAAYDLAWYKGDKRLSAQVLYRDAKAWIFDEREEDCANHMDRLMSFDNICFMLNRRPEIVRQKILKMKKKDVRQYDMFDGTSRI